LFHPTLEPLLRMTLFIHVCVIMYKYFQLPGITEIRIAFHRNFTHFKPNLIHNY
jgi:hypothetical protein